MDSLISLIIFTLPGLLAYFWINLFGLTPTTKRDSSEVVALSALLWIPIVSIVLFIYQILAWVSNWEIIDPSFDVPIVKQDWMLMGGKIADINKLSDNIWFLLYYVVSSIITSFYVARWVSNKGYKFLMDKVNMVREENGIAPFSSKTTVWNEMFLGNAGQIVEYCKVEDVNFSLIGSLVNVPRAHEVEKGIVLDGVAHWTRVMEYYNVPVDKVYIDTSTGVTIKIYNLEGALEAQSLFNERLENGSISLE
ncbi:hypothetical protein [Domibacillus tundrae]|uniref:hypothetical protein n=1 Tax=Domibacillus tundrae TaxID=1587527 RepID=UPI000617A939|nr:hypothetical protein [Domibacillus tundrae]